MGQQITADDRDDGERLDRVVRRHVPKFSRAAAVAAIDAGLVMLNGRCSRKGELVRAGDVLDLSFDDARVGPDPSLSLRVLYEDAWLVLIEKIAGVPTGASRAGELGTAASFLVARYPELADVGYGRLEPGLLHRLDTETSGVLLAARDQETFSALRRAHGHREFDKYYVALCEGDVNAPQHVAAYLRPDQRGARISEARLPGSKPVALELVDSRRVGPWSLVGIKLSFAARHQVRAQLAALGHPVIGDTLYGGSALPGLNRHLLHAARLSFTHPVTGERVCGESALPSELRALLAQYDGA